MNAGVFAALIWLTCAGVVAAYALTSPRRAVIARWAVGDACITVATLAFLFREHMPLWPSVLLVNLCVLSQPWLHVNVLQALSGRPQPLWPGAAVVVGATVVNVALVAGGADLATRAAVIAVAAALVLHPLARLLVGGRRPSLPLVLIGAGLAFMLTGHVLRALIFALPERQPGSLLDGLGPATATGAGLAAVALNMSLLWLVMRMDAQEHAGALAIARDRAEAASRAKSEFIASMSHELRTPLNAVLGFNQLLAEDPAHPLTPKQREWTGYVDEAGRRLLSLVDEILDLARIEAGRVDLTIDVVPLHPVFDQILRDFGPRTTAGGGTLAMEACDLAVRADVDRLRQALGNLVSNALKYGRSGGTITVRAQAIAEGRVRIDVTDDGPGVPVQRRDELFEPFNRLGAEGGRVAGTGIGLHVVRKLVLAMDGDLGYEDAPGGGALFWIILPAAVPRRPEHGNR